MPQNAKLIQDDLAVVWHPCSQMKDHEWLPLIPIRRGVGVWLEDFDGNRYLDAISSWWVNLFGHSHPHINAAVTAQLANLEQVLLAGFTHEPVIRLSQRLLKLAPPGLARCFYTDNGSSAVEAALKMSYHFFRNQGSTHKHKFITLSNSYHGETLGALAVGDVSLYKHTYAPLLMQAITVPSPDCFERESGVTWREHSIAQFEHMRATVEQHALEVCAVIVEPLVQCAGGMRMYDAVYLKLLRKLCDDYGIHLVVDEIATGFGRTGTLFACEQAGITPDMLCLGKGLTGGYLPMAVVMTNDRIYQAFYADYDSQRAFLHSHSYTGNPLACAAANASLDLFEQQPVLLKNQQLASHMAAAVSTLHSHPHVAEVRQQGMILAIELVKNKLTREPYDWRERRGLRVYQYGLQHGVILRPLGNVIYFMPPYVITEAEIRLMAMVAIEGINQATQ